MRKSAAPSGDRDSSAHGLGEQGGAGAGLSGTSKSPARAKDLWVHLQPAFQAPIGIVLCTESDVLRPESARRPWQQASAAASARPAFKVPLLPRALRRPVKHHAVVETVIARLRCAGRVGGGGCAERRIIAFECTAGHNRHPFPFALLVTRTGVFCRVYGKERRKCANWVRSAGWTSPSLVLGSSFSAPPGQGPRPLVCIVSAAESTGSAKNGPVVEVVTTNGGALTTTCFRAGAAVLGGGGAPFRAARWCSVLLPAVLCCSIVFRVLPC
eukprot:gene10704-biopygen264